MGPRDDVAATVAEPVIPHPKSESTDDHQNKEIEQSIKPNVAMMPVVSTCISTEPSQHDTLEQDQQVQGDQDVHMQHSGISTTETACSLKPDSGIGDQSCEPTPSTTSLHPNVMFLQLIRIHFDPLILLLLIMQSTYHVQIIYTYLFCKLKQMTM